MVPRARAEVCADEVFSIFAKAGVNSFGVRINHAGDYPKTLRDARYPVEMLYYQGAWELTELRAVAVVCSRKASADACNLLGPSGSTNV